MLKWWNRRLLDAMNQWTVLVEIISSRKISMLRTTIVKLSIQIWAAVIKTRFDTQYWNNIIFFTKSSYFMLNSLIDLYSTEGYKQCVGCYFIVNMNTEYIALYKSRFTRGWDIILNLRYSSIADRGVSARTS